MFKKPMCSGTAIQKVIGTYELLEMILKELEIDDLISASLVSKEWSRVALDFKGLHQQLISADAKAISFRDLFVRRESVFRFPLALRLTDRTIHGVLILCRPSKKHIILLVWHDRDFKPPEDLKTFSWFEENTLVYSLSPPSWKDCRPLEVDKLRAMCYPKVLEATNIRDIYGYKPNLPSKLKKELRAKTGTEVMMAMFERHMYGEEPIGLVEKLTRRYWSR